MRQGDDLSNNKDAYIPALAVSAGLCLACAAQPAGDAEASFPYTGLLQKPQAGSSR